MAELRITVQLEPVGHSCQTGIHQQLLHPTSRRSRVCKTGAATGRRYASEKPSRSRLYSLDLEGYIALIAFVDSEAIENRIAEYFKENGMVITDRTDNTERRVGTIQYGTGFKANARYYLMLDPPGVEQRGQAANLANGDICFFSLDQMVTPVNLEVIIT